MNFSSSHYPISDIKEWRDTKKLEIRPDYQRKAVWTKVAQQMLIDTIIKNIPMPKIYLETKMINGTKYRVVIDGQQRLTAIFDYIDGKYVLPESYGERWAGKKFEDLDEDEQNVILKYEIDVNCLNNPTPEDVRNLYSRVNKYTVQLNSQELRRADYPGDFIRLAEELSTLDFFENARLFTASMTRRMLDIEYIEELLCVILDGMQNKKETLDYFCEKYQVMENKDDIRCDFLRVLDDIEKIFPEDVLAIRKTRFKQKSDFYSLFAAIDYLHKRNSTLQLNLIEKLQLDLKYLDDKIEPHSDNPDFSDYAIRCTSDANSFSSREFRKNFLLKYLKEAYR